MRKSREGVFQAQEMIGAGILRIDVFEELQRVWGWWIRRVVMGSVDTGEQGADIVGSFGPEEDSLPKF